MSTVNYRVWTNPDSYKFTWEVTKAGIVVASGEAQTPAQAERDARAYIKTNQADLYA